ncbi:Enoyl-CoA hydratase/carnithine racemase [Modestobacter sp. DSM 44400]|uniref:enoyl-CoA hydratase/isomerase family protein n=1 Tax=Modestobacter sp. DSM 44400 TaxID=1550230 RepID=UPI00089C3CB7|nr:enoyl-CoA hydratase/isomerase family protein [Modestobacter sp. DSM 44400]SDX80132.1 Enoyl-CoA hydratase/carnithine racemase [Modestobacter sp. DSM 44400]
MFSSPLVYEPAADGVVRIRLNRPERRNAVDSQTVDALIDALQTDPSHIALLGSTTPGIFCAGADLHIPDDERARVSDRLYACYEVMVCRSAPVIAVLDGPAVGGGAQLATAADLRIASPRAWLRWLGPGHGLAVGAWILPSLVGRARTLDLTLTGRRLTAEQAEAVGVVTEVAGDPWARAAELALQLRDLQPAAVTRTRDIVASGDLLARLREERTRNLDGWSGAGPTRG